ncbi:type II toxin-antitoxin system RelE/ParE family toxin [Ideonella azotifigens]|uniref:Type II toxin-antitoxin system RelE/ParE family toxin n=1 Tax=Ideonella azotifigens TaxID=513160 RepID=A0ABN1KCP4_9BURK|nr:type II toxin-antitoxin system RelE/ParE family toxin [Ideonella azotifigens]MCD2343664.1 type II toxin-antitoxin system RelE/ParE family toxin [Ideonella azotifigens]
MIRYEVEFLPKAQRQLADLEDFIAEGPPKSPVNAANFVTAIVKHCKKEIGNLPHGGVARDDIRPGMRVTHFRGSTVIAFEPDDQSEVVFIHGIFYGGQDYEAVLG